VAFGNGIYGQLGSGHSKNSYFPTRVKLESVESIAAGENHSLFISKGRVFACGDNSNGQVGTVLNKKFLTEPSQ
jgi:alpha-tubulin suppressor-like RCC1 family protein